MRKQGRGSAFDVVISQENEPSDGHSIGCWREQVGTDELHAFTQAVGDVGIRADLVVIEFASSWGGCCCHFADRISGVPDRVSGLLLANWKSHRCTLFDCVARVRVMSRSCAKPTCTNLAVSWFDVSREACSVMRSASPTGSGMALCQVHADRFSVPDGWSLVVVDEGVSQQQLIEPAVVAEPEAVVAAVLDDAVDASETSEAGESNDAAQANEADDTDDAAEITEANREHDRENPWFVPASHAEALDVETDSFLDNPSEGSLLHRAFKGPSASDSVRQGELPAVAQAPVDELSPRRRARSTSDDPEEEASSLYHEFELPFPPHSRQVAVS